MPPRWSDCDTSDDEVENKALPVIRQTAPIGHMSHRIQLGPIDYQTTAWWTKPLMEAAASFRASRGLQKRPLVVATACSGTEAPCLAMQVGETKTTTGYPGNVGS